MLAIIGSIISVKFFKNPRLTGREAGLGKQGGGAFGVPPTARGRGVAHLPLQSSQRAKEQCGASLCMRVAVSRVTTSCTPRTACREET